MPLRVLGLCPSRSINDHPGGKRTSRWMPCRISS